MNTGSFGNVAPDAMQAIQNALARRQQGGGVPALNQQSGASPTAAPLPAEPQGGVSMPQGPVGSEAVAGMPMVNPEAELIIKALASRLKTISDVEKGTMA